MRRVWAALLAPLACVADLDLGGSLGCAANEAACQTPAGPRCVATANDPAHCGACGLACPSAPAADARCEAGRCVLRCRAGRGDCDDSTDNGCEAETDRDRLHCGSCGARCGAGVGCSAGRCILVNVALEGRGEQSSTYTAGSCDRGASLALDGRLCHLPAEYGGDVCADLGCRVVSHTETDRGAWWSVDLGAPRSIERVDVWNGGVGEQVLERSLDGATWTALGPVVARPPWPARIDVRAAARHLRVRATGVSAVLLTEFEAYAPRGGP